MTKQEFSDWKEHPVTMMVFKELEKRIALINEQLVDECGTNIVADIMRSTAIKCYRDLLKIDVDEINSEEPR